MQVTESTIKISDLFPEAKKSGSATYKMHCPFHSDKKPSFVIYPEQQRFHCFGCGEDGSYIDYLMKSKGINFHEAVRELKALAGIQDTDYFDSEEKQTVLAINKSAASFFHSCLLNNKTALDYLASRGITAEDIEKFHLGYCPDSEAVIKHLRSQFETIKASGLIITKGKCFLEGRIVFPILYGENVFGFAGRSINGKEPKYINSPQTVAFRKGKLLYGLSPQSIKAFGYAIVVEGYMDVIAMHRMGFDNAVSPMGTALSEKQLNTLKRYTSNIILMLDGDEAGQKAVERVIGDKVDPVLKVAFLPKGEDPDSLIKKGEEHAIINAVDNAESALSYALKFKKGKERLALIAQHALSAPLEMLPNINSGEQLCIVKELSAAFIVNMLRTTGKVIYRKGDIEIRKWFGYLLAYYKKKFLFWQRAQVEPKQITQIAYEMAMAIQKNRKKE